MKKGKKTRKKMFAREERSTKLSPNFMDPCSRIGVILVEVSVNEGDVGSLVAGDEAISLHPMVEPVVFPGS